MHATGLMIDQNERKHQLLHAGLFKVIWGFQVKNFFIQFNFIHLVELKSRSKRIQIFVKIGREF